MLRSVWVPIRPQRRHFVSSVLLNRTYEDESVAGLKKLLKERGLSQYVAPFLCHWHQLDSLSGQEINLP